jgi:hypothetical protein
MIMTNVPGSAPHDVLVGEGSAEESTEVSPACGPACRRTDGTRGINAVLQCFMSASIAEAIVLDSVCYPRKRLSELCYYQTNKKLSNVSWKVL